MQTLCGSIVTAVQWASFEWVKYVIFHQCQLPQIKWQSTRPENQCVCLFSATLKQAGLHPSATIQKSMETFLSYSFNSVFFCKGDYNLFKASMYVLQSLLLSTPETPGQLQWLGIDAPERHGVRAGMCAHSVIHTFTILSSSYLYRTWSFPYQGVHCCL